MAATARRPTLSLLAPALLTAAGLCLFAIQVRHKGFWSSGFDLDDLGKTLDRTDKNLAAAAGVFFAMFLVVLFIFGINP